VMLYRFPPSFYKSAPSPCAPTGAGQDLSTGDRRGLQTLYPQFGGPVDTMVARRRDLVEAIRERSETELEGFESAAPRASARFGAQALSTLTASLQHL
jgi:hypothetical protein